MNYYQELTLLPCAEISPNFIWQKLYQELHVIIAKTKTQPAQNWVAVSFPDYSDKFLGNKLRVFAQNQQALEGLSLKETFQSMDDYIHLKSIKAVPSNVLGYSRFKRFHQKQKSQSQAKRRAKRHGLSLEEAYEQLNKKPAKNPPFIKLNSLSNGHPYSIMIQKIDSDLSDTPPEQFNAYGLNSPVPHF